MVIISRFSVITEMRLMVPPMKLEALASFDQNLRSKNGHHKPLFRMRLSKKGPPSKCRINWLQSLLEVGAPICSLRCFPLRKTTKNAHLPCEPTRILTDPKKIIAHTIQTTLGSHFPSFKMAAFGGKVRTDGHFSHQKHSS